MEENKEKDVEFTEKNKNSEKQGKLVLWIIVALIFIGIAGILLYAIIKNQSCRIGPMRTFTYVDENGVEYELTEDKPILYLYPEKEEKITVKLGYPEKITCSYPKYENEWQVIAKPDGTLKNVKTGRNLYSLYWEGAGSAKTNMNEGFIVKGEDSASFLEEKLSILGLTERETEEFIIYWLPKLESNKYNYIRFATMEEINEYMPLEFSIKPDTLIRILMQFKGLDEPIKVDEQKLKTTERNGFVAVEWGGTEIQ